MLGRMAVVGVDGCSAGWIAVVLRYGRDVEALYAPTLVELSRRVPDARVFAVDIPIGLRTGARRRADEEARRLLGPRRSSVFFTPIRAALEAPTHADATRRSLELTGEGISQQAYRLGPKILEAERWCRDARPPVWEVHPEVSFTLLLGHPACAPKKTWAGMEERRAALAAEGIHLDRLGEAGTSAAVDDVLDAAVAAWSGRRLVRGEAISLPARPEKDPATRRPVAIWA